MQYFQVGEEVILQSKKYPELNGEYVVEGYYKKGDIVENPVGAGYRWVNDDPTYTLHGCHEKKVFTNGMAVKAYMHWAQSALRKKHQGGESFESLISSIKEGTLEALDG